MATVSRVQFYVDFHVLGVDKPSNLKTMLLTPRVVLLRTWMLSLDVESHVLGMDKPSNLMLLTLRVVLLRSWMI